MHFESLWTWGAIAMRIVGRSREIVRGRIIVNAMDTALLEYALD